VLETDVFALGIFSDDDEVNAGPVGGEAGEIFDGSEVGEEVEFFAERDVDAFEAAADGSGDRAFEGDAVALDGFVEGGGDVLAVDFEGFGPGSKALPLKLDAGGFEDADYGVGDFGADAVAGNERDLVGLCLGQFGAPFLVVAISS